MAVAAGAEKSRRKALPQIPLTKLRTSRSLVDSVMAELRPKIVAEISKKLASERK